MLKPHAFTMCNKVQIYITECILIKGFKQYLSLSVSDVWVWRRLLIRFRMYQLWQLLGQGRWHWMFNAYEYDYVSFWPLICIWDRPHFAARIMLWKTMQKNQIFFFFRSHDIDSSKPFPSSSTSSEHVDNRPPTQEGKQTSQGNANTREKMISWIIINMISNQLPMKNADYDGRSQAQG